VDAIIRYFIFIRPFCQDTSLWHTHPYAKSQKSDTSPCPSLRNIICGWPLRSQSWSLSSVVLGLSNFRTDPDVVSFLNLSKSLGSNLRAGYLRFSAGVGSKGLEGIMASNASLKGVKEVILLDSANKSTCEA